MGDPAIPLPHVLEALTRGWSNGELMRAAQPDGIQAMGGINRSRGEVFWDSRRGADLPVAELLATCAMRLGAVRFAVLQRNVNHGFTIAVTTQDHLVLIGVHGLAVRKHRLSNDRAAVASTSTRFSPKTFPKGAYNLADYER